MHFGPQIFQNFQIDPNKFKKQKLTPHFWKLKFTPQFFLKFSPIISIFIFGIQKFKIYKSCQKMMTLKLFITLSR